jgi:hypothetical protein
MTPPLRGHSSGGEGTASATRLRYRRQARPPAPQGQRRAAPNSHADSGGPAPQGRAAVPGAGPGRSRYSSVPGPAASRKAAGSPPGGGGQLGTAHGRGGSSGDPSSRHRGRQASRARPASHQSGGLPGLRPRTPGRARGPVAIRCHRCGWPRRLPFGLGSPAAPRLSAARSARRRTPPWCAACGRRPAPACGPAPTAPWPCPASTTAAPAGRRRAGPSGPPARRPR